MPGSGDGGRVTKEDVQKFVGRSGRRARSLPPPVATWHHPHPTRPTRCNPLNPFNLPTPKQPAGRTQRRARADEQATRHHRQASRRGAAHGGDAHDLQRDRHDGRAGAARAAEGSLPEAHGVNLGLSSFFVKAAVGALKAFPRINAEIQGDEMVLKHYYDIGIAVGASSGLVVPVLRDADAMSFWDIEGGIKDFARRAEDGTLSLDEIKGGTFTITNGGVFGSMLSTPILNPPQVGILGLHKIEDRPVAINGQVVIRPMMYVALSYDHRIVDGLEAVQFLVSVKEFIEDPGHLLIEG